MILSYVMQILLVLTFSLYLMKPYFLLKNEEYYVETKAQKLLVTYIVSGLQSGSIFQILSVEFVLDIFSKLWCHIWF